MLLALAAHVAVLYALVREPAEPLAGAAGRQVDAITITLVSSAAQEAREQPHPEHAPAAATAVDSLDGALESRPAVLQPDPPKEVKERLDPEQAPNQAALLVLPEPPKPQPQEASPAAAGGASARGEATSPHQSAAAAASPGAMREYARYVSQALAKAKPKSVGVHGTVRITLRIAPNGEVAQVEVSQSSGSSRLDEAVVGAVQRVKLPSPPPGMTAEQRFYQLNYYFR